MRNSLSLALTSAAFAATLALAGCAGDATRSDSPAQGQAAQHEATATPSEQPVTLEAGWAKAADGMSGVFGTLHNASAGDITLVSATSSAADVVELHESVSTGANVTMSEVEGGFTVPAGGTFELAPGGNHIMLMELTAGLLPGDEVPVTLAFDDGSTIDVTVLAKDYGGAQENYEGDGEDAHAGH